MQVQLLRSTIMIVPLIWLSSILHAQKNQESNKDSLHSKQGYVSKMQQFAKESAISSENDFQADRAERIQEATFVEIKKNLQKAKLYRRTGLDTMAVKNELALIVEHSKMASKDVFDHSHATPTQRNLLTTQKIIKVLLYRCGLQKKKLDDHKKRLSDFKFELDSLSNVKEIFEFPTDSAKLSKYMQSLVVLAREVAPLDSLIESDILQAQTLQARANMLLYSLESRLDEITVYQRNLADRFFDIEFAMSWKNFEGMREFAKTFAYSFAKGRLNLQFFTTSNLGPIVLGFLLLGICYAFILSLKRTYLKEVGNEELGEDQLVLRYPFLSALFLTSNFVQFFFSSPPFIFSLLFWLVAATCLTLLMKGYISRFWMGIWGMLLLLFLLSCLDNLILQPSYIERWMMLLLSLAGAFIGFWVFRQNRREELREKLIIYAIALMVVLETVSLFLNFFGGYDLTKAFMVAGYVNVVIAIMFLWSMRLVNQGLQLAYSLYARRDKSLFFMNFGRVGESAPILLYIVLVLGWLILVGKNFPAYAFLIEPVRDFFFDQRVIGSYSFSVSSLILFFFVVSMSVIISKVVSFFALDKRTFDKQQNVKRGIGSWILLVRITIIILGLFLAFAAVGIPIDKIAIVIGALGVGIGFGLQSLVNNLVSGLVIAFEKPVNLDDEIEIAGRSGTVKSIGFRSSVISTFDGAEIVMPNGDLLNSHLVNWSSGNGKRRSSIVVNITHDANLQLVRDGILNILDVDDRILKHPEPSVFFQDINSEALTLNILYWTKKGSPLFEIKNDVIIAVNKLFADNNIKVPLPKHEIFIHDEKTNKHENKK